MIRAFIPEFIFNIVKMQSQIILLHFTSLYFDASIRALS